MNITQPPSAEQISLALGRLPNYPRDEAQALTRALHLALPADEIPLMVVTRESDGLHYRGTVIPEGDGVAEVASRVARAGWRRDDLFLDLDAEPSSWIKVVRSGSRRIAFGARLLFGTPELSLEDGVPEEVAYAVVQLAIDQAVQAPQILFLSSEPVLLDGDAASWTLRSGDTMRWSEGPPMAMGNLTLGFAERIRVELGGDTVELVELVHGQDDSSDVEVIVERGEWEFIVPAVITHAAEVIGVPSGAMVEDDVNVALPDDFKAVGLSRFEDAIVAVHTPTAYRVLVRQLSTRR
jgi:hypothetical protein